jgi:mRNA interferase MazF
MDRETEAYQGGPARTVSQGDLFWIRADESRGSVPGHPHPYVVIQDNVLNRSRISTVVVCAVSSNLNKAKEPGNVLLETEEGNLGRQSVVVVSQVSCLYKTRLGEHIGALSSQRVEQILAGMRFQQTSFFSRQ